MSPTPDRLDLADDEAAFILGDPVRDQHDTTLGTIDRVVVNTDLRCLTHLGVQPTHHWQWPRLVDLNDLASSGPSARGHVLSHSQGWPQGWPTADVLPGVPQDELPDHPIVPTSGIQQFLLSLTTPPDDGTQALPATLRNRTRPDETTLRPGTTLVEWDPHAIAVTGRVVGIVATVDGTVHDVLVTHRHGLRRRTARLPVARVKHAGIGQVTTTASRRDLDSYDVPVPHHSG